MKRTKAHQIDTQAQRILDSRLPVDWVTRKQYPDYGIDYEIEVFHNEQPTGIWFRVQLKGRERYQETEDSIVMPFETDKIEYYLSKVPFPVFLFVVLTQKKEIYWLFLQKYVNEVLKVENPSWMDQKSVTIRIPKKNLFKDNIKRIELEAKKGMTYMYALHFGTPHWSVSFAVKGAIDNVDKLEAERKKHLKEQNEIDLHLAAKYYQTGSTENSQRLLFEVFDRTKDKDDHILEHLSSVSGIISLYPFYESRQSSEVLNLSEYGLSLAKRIQNKRFIHFFEGSSLEVIYYRLLERIQNSRILQKVVESRSRSIAYGYPLRLFQSEDYRSLLEVSRKYLRNIYESFKDEEYWVSLDMLVRLIRINLFPYPRLIADHTKRELTPLIQNVSDLIENSLRLAGALNYRDLECEILKYKALLYYFQNLDGYRDILKSMKALASEHNLELYVKEANDMLHHFGERTSFPEGPDDFPKPPPIEEMPDQVIDSMHRMLAEAVGIDLENDEDEFAHIVRVGLEDRNPERVLKYCSHLEIAEGSYGIVGEFLNLPTAGSKVLFCKYGGGFEGLSLDRLFEMMKRNYCTNCKHRDPMPRNWKWSLKWQKEKDKKRTVEFQRFISGCNAENC